MSQLSRGNLTMIPGRTGVTIAHGMEFIGKLDHVREDGTIMVAIPGGNFLKPGSKVEGLKVYDPRKTD